MHLLTEYLIYTFAMSSVEIGPDVLDYRSPLTQQSTEYVSIANRSDQAIAFKVKTTAPKFYCVRPNAALVAPGEQVQVQVIFLGLPEEPAEDYKCRDKFLVITLPCPYELSDRSVAEAWSDLEAEFKKEAISKKIKVRYTVESAGNDEEIVSQGDAAQNSEKDVVVPQESTKTTTGTLSNREPQTHSVEGAVDQQQQDISIKKAIDDIADAAATPSKSQRTATETTSVQSTKESSVNPAIIGIIALVVLVVGYLYR